MTTTDVPAPAPGSGEMFDGIAARYDVVNRVMSFGMDLRWRREAVRALALPPRAQVLDLATGTGDVALAVARAHPDATVRGLDPSHAMLERGRRKVEAAGLTDRVTLEVGVAESLPCDGESVDAV